MCHCVCSTQQLVFELPHCLTEGSTLVCQGISRLCDSVPWNRFTVHIHSSFIPRHLDTQCIVECPPVFGSVCSLLPSESIASPPNTITRSCHGKIIAYNITRQQQVHVHTHTRNRY